MSGFAPLAPAQGSMTGVPAGFQQSPASLNVETAKTRRTGRKDGQRKYRQTTRRRDPGDNYPGLTGNELHDVEKIFHWLSRGSRKVRSKAYSMVTWKNSKMGVEQAHARMVMEHPGSCAHLNRGCCRQNAPCRDNLMPPQQQAFVLPDHMPRPPPQGPEYLPTQQQGIQHLLSSSPQVPMPAQQDPSSAGHSSGYLQDAALGAQPPFPQVSVSMPQHADFLQVQGLGYQNPAPQNLPVAMPVSQFHFGTGDSAEIFPAGPQQFEITVFTPDFLPQEAGSLATPPVVGWMTDGYDAFFDHGSPDFALSLPGSSPENPFALDNGVPAPSGSLGTELTVPDFAEGLQDSPVGLGPDMQEWLPETAQPAQDMGFDLSGTGTQFQNEAIGDLPVDDWGMFEALCDTAAFGEPITQG